MRTPNESISSKSLPRYLGASSFAESTPVRSIIAIPGMDNLNPLNSWKHPDTDAVWLRDFLPQDVPHTRILLWGYSALFPVEPFPYTIDDVGLSLLGDIMASRTKNPVSIQIPHSAPLEEPDSYVFALWILTHIAPPHHLHLPRAWWPGC